MKLQKFSPPRGFKNPHLQTLLSYYLWRSKEPGSKTQFVTLKDGDQIALEISKPDDWQETGLVVLMMPGTAGSHQSPYLVRLTQKLLRKNVLVARLNFRGVASAFGRAKKVSHGGSSQDILAAIEYLKQSYPKVLLIPIGFSLSGNTLLKLAGEMNLSTLVEKVIAICPPLDLAISSQKLEKFQNRLYQHSIVSRIIQIISSPGSAFTYIPQKPLAKCKTLREVDDLFTAPSSGFNDAVDYYTQSSALHLVPDIETPAYLLFAQDDPLIDCQKIQEKKLPEHIHLFVTRYGGHMGYLQSSFKNPFWMDEVIFQWLDL